MGRVGKYTTFNRIRLVLFARSYACYFIVQYLRVKYKIDDKLPPIELRRKYFDKRTIPEISRLARSLNFEYRLLWQALMLNKNPLLGKRLASLEGIRFYLAIESELITLAASRRNRSRDFFDPDYENESAMLKIAIERATGNLLSDIEDDFVFEKQLEELQRIYLKWYYKVAYKYKLPTTRIVPFVLRLII